jgi:transcription elongation factor Elf1
MEEFKNKFSRLEDFTDLVNVKCPKCAHPALVKRTEGTKARFICESCGSTKYCNGNSLFLGNPFDPYFKYDLIYVANYHGNILWFYSKRHLQYVKAFIEAKIRKREKDEYGFSNSSLISRLPEFIKSKKESSRFT